MDELLATPPSSGVDAAPVSNTIAPAASSSPLF
jgi:hypothetical protein